MRIARALPACGWELGSRSTRIYEDDATEKMNLYGKTAGDLDLIYQKSYDRYLRVFDMQDLVSGSEDKDEEAVDKPHFVRSDGEIYVGSHTNKARIWERIDTLQISRPQRIPVSMEKTFRRLR
jgi:hypothetical protein